MTSVLSEAMSHGFVSRVRGVPHAVAWSNVLRLLPAPATELPRRACTSKRAMVSMVKGAARNGLVEVDGDDVRITELGRAADPGWPPARCAPLATVVSQLALEHPHHVVPYGGSDGSMTGGPGVDWKPVRREPDSDVSRLSMVALLSQALTAFAIEYESERVGPIVWAADLLQRIPDGGAALADFPARGTHSIKNVERVGIVIVDGAVVHLTPIGRAVRDAYHPLAARIEADWRSRYGDDIVDGVIAAVDVAGDDLPAFPVVAWHVSAHEFGECSPC
jgi:hypothetical protein